MIRRRLAAGFAAAAIAVALAGCSAPSGLDDAAGTRMQQSVVAVADAVVAGDATSAAARLDDLQAQLDAAITNDLVSAARAARIQNAIDAARADLQSLVAPAPAPSPTTVATTSQSGDDEGGGNGNSGPGNNNGNGNDKGNGKDGKGKGH